MKAVDHKNWTEKNRRLNANVDIQVGDNVKDSLGVTRTVLEIIRWDGPLTAENHGGIRLLQNDGTEETYSLYGWQSFFRITGNRFLEEKENLAQHIEAAPEHAVSKL